MFQQKLFSLGGFHLKSTGFHTDFMKSGGFHEIQWISYGFHEIWWISYGFHEIRRISCEIERPLARNCNPMFLYFETDFYVNILNVILAYVYCTNELNQMSIPS